MTSAEVAIICPDDSEGNLGHRIADFDENQLGILQGEPIIDFLPTVAGSKDHHSWAVSAFLF